MPNDVVVSRHHHGGERFIVLVVGQDFVVEHLPDEMQLV